MENKCLYVFVIYIHLQHKKKAILYRLMSCKTILYILLLSILSLWGGTICAQEHSDGRPQIDSAMAISPDFSSTRHTQWPTIQFFPLHYNIIDTSLVHISEYDPLLRIENLYQSLGINGQAHKSMIFDIQEPAGFSMITLPYPLYFKKMQDLKIYDVHPSYTDLNFTYTFLTGFAFKATHAQHIRQVDFAVNLDAASDKGYFIHQEINRLTLDASMRYETPKKMYGFLLAYIFNHGKFAENGGLEYSPDFTERDPRHDSTITYDLTSFPVMFSNGNSKINTHALQITNYFNIKDKKGHYFGTISHTLDFNHLSSHFTDYDLNNMFYLNRYYINTDTTNDSIQYNSIANTFQLSNFSPTDTIGDQSYFFRIAGGLRHEYVKAQSPMVQDNNLCLFARTSIRLFKVWEIYGLFSYNLFKYTQNDALAKAGFRFSINKKQQHYIGLEATFSRRSPDYFFSNYSGNNNFWTYDWKKQNFFKASAYWTIFNYKASFNFINAGRYVYLNNNFEPVQLEKPFQVIQLMLYAPVRTKYFCLDAQLALQHATNKVIAVPLFAGKLGALYTTRIFKKRLRFQVGVDLFYNTKYFADGYNPLLHQFYSQQYIITGNYLYINAHIALRVKRISFFVRGGNLFAGLMSFRYITTPGYPMQGRNFEVGVNWKFYD